jgi:hypothetical protein
LVGETFQGFTVPKLRRRSIPRMQVRPRFEARKRKQRPRPLILQKIFQGEGRRSGGSRESTIVSDREEEKIWTVEVSHPGNVGERSGRENIWAIRSSLDNR